MALYFILKNNNKNIWRYFHTSKGCCYAKKPEGEKAGSQNCFVTNS